MCKKVIWSLIVGGLIRSFAFAMEPPDGEVIAVLGAHVKFIHANREDQFYLDVPPFRFRCILSSVNENVAFVDKLKDEKLYNGTWSSTDRECHFSCPLPLPLCIEDLPLYAEHSGIIKFSVQNLEIILVNPCGLRPSNFRKPEGLQPGGGQNSGRAVNLTGRELKQLWGFEEFFLEKGRGAARHFKLVSKDGSSDHIVSLHDGSVFPGIWSSFEKGWLFKCPFPAGVEILNSKKQKILGVVFTINEVVK